MSDDTLTPCPYCNGCGLHANDQICEECGGTGEIDPAELPPWRRDRPKGPPPESDANPGPAGASR